MELVFFNINKNLFVLFPELNAIKPENADVNVGWFDYGDNIARIKALKKMIEIAELLN
jgi:hypothetical protein